MYVPQGIIYIAVFFLGMVAGVFALAVCHAGEEHRREQEGQNK